MSATSFPLLVLLAAATAALLSLPACRAFHGQSADYPSRSSAQAQNDFLLSSAELEAAADAPNNDEDEESVMMLPVKGAPIADSTMGRLQPYLMLPFVAAIREALSARDGSYPSPALLDDNGHVWTDKRTNQQPSVGKRLKQMSRSARNKQQTGGSGGGGGSLSVGGLSGSWQQPARDPKSLRSVGGPSLSVDTSLDMIRNRFSQGLRRKQNQENRQSQIDSNRELLRDIGKRDTQRSAAYRDNGEPTLAPPLAL